MDLATPTYIASVAYLVLVLVIIFAPASTLMHVNGADDAIDQRPSTLSSKLISVVLLFIPIALSIYSINCYVVGGCVVWSWINAISILLWVLLLVLVVVLSVKKQ
jgi:hypothetical protein